MIFYSSARHPTGAPHSLQSVRTLVSCALLLYPIGALVRSLGPDTATVQLGGFALIVVALFCAALVVGSQINRVTAEVPAKLDEYELQLRARAMGTAYVIFCVATLLAIIYLALASNFELWAPRGYDEWNGVFWGAFLTSSLLPTAVLAWTMERGDLAFQPDEGS